MRDIMPLMPIRFKNAQDLNAFLSHLQDLELITLENDSVKTTPELAKQFIKATDGSIYLINDVLNYLKEASEEEINASKLSFFTGAVPALSSLRNNVTSVTLAQIKADSTLVEQLHTTDIPAAFISVLNPNLYSEKPFTVQVGQDAIAKDRASLSNKKLAEAVTAANTVMENLDALMGLLKGSTKTSSLPLPYHSSDFLLELQQDTYKITLMQQIKLKYHLQKQLQFMKDFEEKALVLQWIRTIDRENAAMRQLLSNMITMLKTHNDSAKEARVKYEKMLADDPTLEKLKAELEAKSKEAKELFDSIENSEAVLAVLKPILVYGTMIAAYLLLMAAIIVTPALIMALTTTMPLLGLSLVIIETVSVVLLSALAVDGIFELGQLIENKLDSIVDEKNEQYKKLSEELATLQVDNLFITAYSKNSAEFIENGPGHDAFIEQIESDLFDVDTLEAEGQSKMESIRALHRASKPSVAGLFQQKPEAPRHSSADDLVELTARGSFEI